MPTAEREGLHSIRSVPGWSEGEALSSSSGSPRPLMAPPYQATELQTLKGLRLVCQGLLWQSDEALWIPQNSDQVHK